MPYKIKTMNNISPNGLALFGARYSVSQDEPRPDAILVRSSKVNVAEFPGVLAVARAGAGINNITVDKASELGICVFNTPGANANAVAELTFTVLGIALRCIHHGLEFAVSLRTIRDDLELNATIEASKSKLSGSEIAGKRMVVIGLGKIGVLVANGAISRNMTAVAYDPHLNVRNVHQLYSSVTIAESLIDAIDGADILSVHVPLDESTRGLIGAQVLARLKKGAVVMNFARGPVVDTEAIIQALDQNQVQTYLTDFPTHKFLNHPKVICTPHLGASTAEAEENCATMAVLQLKDFLEFGVVRNSVNFPTIDGKPAHNVRSRITVVNRDVPQMIAQITDVIGKAGLNIHSFKNESNGKIGYNIVDLDVDVGTDVLERVRRVPNIIAARHLSF